MKRPTVLLLRRWLLARLIPEWWWPKTVLLNGVNIQLRHSPYSFGTRWLIRKELYEKEERQLLQTILQPGMQVIEMGGSIGVLSAIIAQAISTKGRLVSVEASKTLAAYSRNWLEKQPHVKVVTGYAFPVFWAPAIQVNKFDETTGSLGGKVSYELAANSMAVSEENYDIATLCSKFGLQPDVLVVDVEGSELLMADYPPQLPPSIKYLLIELHKGLYPNGIADENRIVQAIEKDGFFLHHQVSDVYLFTKNLPCQ